jgi:response regulator of citrate/malate metabolism
MNIDIVTKEDLAIFKQELIDELIAFYQTTRPRKETREWLKTWEVMKIFNMSKGKLQSLRANGTLTYSRVGKNIYFKYAEIMALMEQNQINNGPGVGRGYNRYSMANKNRSQS